MKKICTAVAALVIAASVSHAQPIANVSLINHNIHSGGQPQAAADHIEDLLAMTPQKMLVLCNEANYARQYFPLPYSGWQYKWKGSPHEARGNPIFARNAAATVLNSWVMEMQEPWTHLQPKDPRVYTVVKCQLVNHPWVKFICVNVHFPTNKTGNGPARQESVDRLIELSENNSDIPLIICGDFNMGVNEVKNRIADPIDGKIYSDASVDHIILRNGKYVGFENSVDVVRMGKFISDHQALRYNFAFKVRNQVIDNSDPGFAASGDWASGTSAADKYGDNYRFRATAAVSDAATWTFDVPATSDYQIYAWWSQGPNRSITAPYILPDSTTVYKNQQAGGGSWQSLGTLNLSAGTHQVGLSCWTSNGNVVIGDAIKLVPR